LQSTPPPPGTTLLSSHEAKERLREIVEGFFFRRLRAEDGKPTQHLLVKSPPGLGGDKRGYPLGHPLSPAVNRPHAADKAAQERQKA
jgi:hypothetical protein